MSPGHSSGPTPSQGHQENRPRSWILIMTSCFRVLFPATHSGTYCNLSTPETAARGLQLVQGQLIYMRPYLKKTNNKKLSMIVHTCKAEAGGLLKAQDQSGLYVKFSRPEDLMVTPCLKTKQNKIK